jgi:hypothetical protein
MSQFVGYPGIFPEKLKKKRKISDEMGKPEPWTSEHGAGMLIIGQTPAMISVLQCELLL